MNCPKIPPNCITNYITNMISGYLRSATLGIFVGTPQGQNQKQVLVFTKRLQKYK